MGKILTILEVRMMTSDVPVPSNLPSEGAASLEPPLVEESDHALEVLLEVRSKVAPECPEELLRQCFKIQRQFQFDRDDELPLVHTRRLVEGFVEREGENKALDEGGEE
jgi:hypothetical protein